MAITIHIFYTGSQGSARRFAQAMVDAGLVRAIREEKGNVRYEYFFPMEDPETVLLIDAWENQAALDAHHASPLMGRIAALRDQYDLHMKVERFLPDSGAPQQDQAFIRK